MNLDNITNKLQLSVDLVKEWGESALPNGQTLAEIFTYDSISFWDVMSVYIALYCVPPALFPYKQFSRYSQLIRTYLRWCKYKTISQQSICKRENKQCDRPSKPVYMFLGFQPYLYNDTLQPIIRNMVNDKEVYPVNLYDNMFLKNHFQQIEGSKLQFVWQHWNSDVKAQAYKLKNLLKTTIKKLKNMGVLPQIIQNQGESLWPQMRDTFDWLFIVYLPYLMKHFAVARRILDYYRPEVIISPDNSDPRVRLYCILGGHLKIPTLEIQFGMYGQASVEWQFCLADRIAAWGETSRNTLMLHGVPSEKIVLSGSPRHDCMVSISKTEALQTRSILRIPDGALMIVFASSYLSIYDEMEDPSLIDSVKRAIFQAADQFNGICLVVKPHPAENVSETKKLAQGFRNILFVHQNDDIKKLIRACDVFISLGSTATMDAIIANKLTICPNFPGWIWSDLFVNSGATLVPKSKDELLNCLKMAIDGDRQKVLDDLETGRLRFLKQWIFKADGQASNRIKSLLFEMKRDVRS